jgi:hypothetical protein
MKRKEPVRLHKKEERRPLIENNSIAGIPLSFILMTIIMVCFFILIMIFMGPCTDSGLVYNGGLA